MTTNESKSASNANGGIPRPDAAGDATARQPNQLEKGGKKAQPLTDKALSRHLESANRTFYDARFDIVWKKLCPENQAGWDKLPFTRKCLLIHDLIKAGIVN